MSHLTEDEKIFVRLTVIELHVANKHIFMHTDLRSAIEKTNGTNSGSISKINKNLKSAKDLQKMVQKESTKLLSGFQHISKQKFSKKRRVKCQYALCFITGI